MLITESKKYLKREGKPSKITITAKENKFFYDVFSRMRNEPCDYVEVTLKFKAKKICHVFFEDSVPVIIEGEDIPNEPTDATVDEARTATTQNRADNNN